MMETVFFNEPERLIFNYDVSNRNNGILLVDLGQVTPRSEAIGLNPTSLQALFHRINKYGNDYFADIAEIKKLPQDGESVLSIKPKGFVNKGKQINDFNTLGFSLVNVNQIFDMFEAMKAVDVPIFSDERKDSDRIVIIGGSSTINPIPLGMFADAVVLGQGEEALLQMTKVLERKDINKIQKLELISKIQGVYVPTAQEETVDFAEIHYNEEQFVPGSVIVVDGKASLVISRSCPHNCAFCRLSSSEMYQKKPFKQLMDHLDLLKANGAKEVAIVSASASTYRDEGKTVNDIIDAIVEKGMTPKHMADRPEQIGYASQQSVILAPEASPELRRNILGKTIKEGDLTHAIDEAIKAKVKKITFYGITGILPFDGRPGETENDLLYFKELADYVNRKAEEANIDISIEFNMMPLMPSPHTDLETYPMASWEAFQANLTTLNGLVTDSKNVKFATHLEELDFMLEAMLNRGTVDEGVFCYEAYELSKNEGISFKDALAKILLIKKISFDKFLAAKNKGDLPYLGKVRPLRRRRSMRIL